MDKMDGDEATKIVIYFEKKIIELIKSGEYQNVCIVGHSSDDNHQVIQNFLQNGAQYFERKPMSLENL